MDRREEATESAAAEQLSSGSTLEEDAESQAGDQAKAVQLSASLIGTRFEGDSKAPVQMNRQGATPGGDVQAVAARGFGGAAARLPHAEKIQASFGSHDIGGVKAHVGGAAAEANQSLGAVAYTSGNQVAFSADPDLHTSAHEAAHVVQQQSGVALKGGVGEAGDSYERHADQVADQVVRGESAEDLLSEQAGNAASIQTKAVQFTGHPLDQALPAGAETPAHVGGRKATLQRQYSVEQYIAMWEEEHKREMTDEEKETLARGCIGITALNLTGGGNPPLDKAYSTFDGAWAEVEKLRATFAKNPDAPDGQGGTLKDWKPVMFAKMFWSNQSPYDPNMATPDPKKSGQENHIENVKANRRAWDKPDSKAFPTDEKTGKVDMTGYKYDWARPKDPDDVTVGEDGNLEMDWHVNFDYAFWDESTQTFWHANHCQPGMKVYQSTRERFERGYRDFDRTIYCVAFSKNFVPATEAGSH